MCLGSLCVQMTNVQNELCFSVGPLVQRVQSAGQRADCSLPRPFLEGSAQPRVTRSCWALPGVPGRLGLAVQLALLCWGGSCGCSSTFVLALLLGPCQHRPFCAQGLACCHWHKPDSKATEQAWSCRQTSVLWYNV